MRSLLSLLRRLYPGVSTRITIPFLLIILIVAGIGTFIVTRLVAGTIDERVNNQLADGAQTALNTITEIERNYLAILRQMTFTQGIAAAIAEGDSAQIETLLEGIAINQGVDELLVFDADGTTIYRLTAGAEQQPALVDVSEWEIVQNVLGRFQDERGDKFADVHMLSERTVFVFTAPVFDETDDVVGGVGIGMASQRFVRLVSEQSLTTLVLTDLSGTVIDSTVQSLVEPQPADFLTVPDEPDDDLFRDSPFEERTLEGSPYKFLVVRLELRDQLIGALGVALPTNFVAERIGTSRDSFALLFAVMFIGVTSIGILVSRSIIRPLLRIVDTTRAISSGDLSQRVRLRAPDELGELGRSFDHMTDQLVVRNQEISQLYNAQLIETARREAMLGSISDVVIVQDNQGNSIFTNAAARAFYRALSTTARAHQDEFYRMIHAPALLSEPRMVTFAQQHFSAVSTPVRMSTGEKLGYVIVLRDITEIIQAQQLKDEMILQLSHELKTPYATAFGFAELMQLMVSTGQTEKAAGYTGPIIDNLKHLGRMIDRVIEVSAILAGETETTFEEFNYMSLMADLVHTYRQPIADAGLELSFTSQSNDILIEADHERLYHALETVLENAMRYTLSGGKVAVRVRHNDEVVLTEIMDTGVGIPPDEQKRVFDRMFRGTSAGAGPTDTRGLGLGLYISRQIIDAHYGSIELDSKVDVGTVVRIKLPRTQRERS
jgi:signal transduction histidine kinase